jgi:CHAT domain-containing protein/tetratricopeptide (TPR) repeat protein
MRIYRRLARKNPAAFLPDLAMSLNNLGNRLGDLGRREEALTAAEEAMRIRRRLARKNPAAFLPDLAKSLNSLGICLGVLGRREEALTAAEEALATVREFGENDLLHEIEIVVESHRRIAQVKCQAGDFTAARRHLATATKLIERSSSRLSRAMDRELAIQQFSDCLALRARVAVRYWELKHRAEYLHEALQAAEMARSRNLLELMGDAERLPNARSLTRRAWLKHLRGVRQAEWRLDALERRATQAHGGTMSNRPATPRWAEERFAIVPVTGVSEKTIPADPRELQEARAELRTARHRLGRLVTEIRREDPDFDPFQPVRPLSARDQLAMVTASESEVWCISWLVTEHRTLAFVLAPGVQPVGLDLGEAGSNSMKEVAARLDWNGRSQQPSLRRVAELILWPLLKILPREAMEGLPGHLILVANGILQSLPLHALPLPDEWGGGCLGDRFATSTTPSLSLAHRLARSASTHCRGSLAVVNPESWSEGFLGFGALEGIAFREHHDQAKVCMGYEATVESLLEASASGPGIIHVSAHMGSNPKAPLESAIRLNDRLLPLRELYGRLRTDGTWLTILNGCESGVIGEAAAGNPEGLPLGFLFGGSTNVISTLRRVLDVSSALLMDRFHQELRPGVSASMALKRASDWLRGHHSVPDALVDGRAAARAIREFARRARTLRGKPKLSKPWREILRHCTDRAREVEPDCDPPFAALQHWAAHIAIGASWLPMPPPRKPRMKPSPPASPRP